MIHFDVKNMKNRIKELENKTMTEGFWNNTKSSSILLQELKNLKYKENQYNKMVSELDNLIDLNNLLSLEMDENLAYDLIKSTKKLGKEIEKFEIRNLLSGKYDKNNAIISLHPGAGGTESQDWVEMLYRMYSRWAEKNDFTVKELEYLEGDEAGIKSVTALISGNNAYGYLKSEKGVHRLVRISPFDAGGRRHTSFASLEVLPEITDDIQININSEDLRIDTYRASGAGRTAY